MSISLPNGSTVAGASGYAPADVVTGITNAAAPLASSVAHGLAVGDYVEVTSGWTRLNGKVVRVGTVPDANSFTLEGIDTTNTTIYPAGNGGGSVRKITGWTQIQQILSSSSSGGDQQFYDYQLLESDQQARIPTVKNAAGWALELADDPSLAGYQWASTANDDRSPRAVKITLANGSIITYSAYVSLNKIPSLTVNQAMAVSMTLSFLNEPVRYVS